MPNIDANTYFFTAMVPVHNDRLVPHLDGRISPIHVVREYLEVLPTALQSPATVKLGEMSPFAKNDRTHFARFVILDQPHFNGRVGGNIFWELIRGVDLLIPQRVDQIGCPYIMMSLVFDVADNSNEGEPETYFRELWGQMEKELTQIFKYCYSFENVHDGESFAKFMVSCQIDTSLTLHDYWWDKVDLPTYPIVRALLSIAAGFLLPLVAGLIGWIAWKWAILLSLGLTVLIGSIVYRHIMRKGALPYPASPGTDLRHIMKGLYLQQGFIQLALENQGKTTEEQGANLRAFLKKSQPGNIDGPTQQRGTIRSGFGGDGA